MTLRLFHGNFQENRSSHTDEGLIPEIQLFFYFGYMTKYAQAILSEQQKADKNLTVILNPVPAKKRQYDKVQDEILKMIKEVY